MTRLQWLALGVKEVGFCSGKAAQPVGIFGNQGRKTRADFKSLPGECNNRLNQARPLQLTIFLMGIPQQFDCAGSADRASADYGIIEL